MDRTIEVKGYSTFGQIADAIQASMNKCVVKVTPEQRIADALQGLSNDAAIQVTRQALSRHRETIS